MAKKKNFHDHKGKTWGEAMKSMKKRDKPCIRINFPTSHQQPDSSCTSVSSCNTVYEPFSVLTNFENQTDYDDDFEHSKDLHRKICQEHQKTWYASIKKRKFITTDLQDYAALLGKGKLCADHMPASDLKLRNKMGGFLIDEMAHLFELGDADPDLDFRWITIVADKYMFNERSGTAEIYKCKQAVQAVLRNHTELDCIGVIETQPIINYPLDQEGKMFSVHAHVFCWGPTKQTAKLKRHAKRFKSSITKLPIHSSRVYHAEGSFGRLGRYMVKPPYEGKEVDYTKLGLGEACLRPARRVEKFHHLRLFELNAKAPMESLIFGVREGVKVRQSIVARMHDWQKIRNGEEVKLGHRVDALFEGFLRDNNKRLKNYEPFKVKFRKD